MAFLYQFYHIGNLDVDVDHVDLVDACQPVDACECQPFVLGFDAGFEIICHHCVGYCLVTPCVRTLKGHT